MAIKVVRVDNLHLRRLRLVPSEPADVVPHAQPVVGAGGEQLARGVGREGDVGHDARVRQAGQRQLQRLVARRRGLLRRLRRRRGGQPAHVPQARHVVVARAREDTRIGCVYGQGHQLGARLGRLEAPLLPLRARVQQVHAADVVAHQQERACGVHVHAQRGAPLGVVVVAPHHAGVEVAEKTQEA